MYEEIDIAKKGGYENPINNGIEATAACYNSNL